MGQPQPVERFDTVIPLMTPEEARACVASINGHMNSARAELLRLYEGRGWAALGYPSWRECVVSEFDQTQRTLYKQLEAAHIEQRVAPMGQIGTIPERQLRPLSALTPLEQPLAWQEANERSNGKPTARIVEDVVREMRPPSGEWRPEPENVFSDPAADRADAIRDARAAMPRVNAGLFSSATPEWYTPAHIIARVEAVFGHIDLDPCSNSNDPLTASVPALAYWTHDDDGLVQPWHGKVYMNPPYGDVIGAWVARMLEAYTSGEITEAIALLPARVDTAWFQSLYGYPICMVRGRLRFSGAENSAPFPSAIVYCGADHTLFYEQFKDIGPITGLVAQPTQSTQSTPTTPSAVALTALAAKLTTPEAAISYRAIGMLLRASGVLPALPVRPKAPRSADISVQAKYLADLERYADAMDAALKEA